MLIAKLKSWQQKKEILAKKSKLKGKKLYIDKRSNKKGKRCVKKDSRNCENEERSEETK